MCAISRTAWSNTAWLACEGRAVPLTLRTYCSAAAVTSSRVAGGSKLLSGRMLRHMRRGYAAGDASMARMATPGSDRELDLVLLGATGFTGALTAEYLARHAPAGLRWGLAGRSPEKLERVRDRLAAPDPASADLPLIAADVTDAASLAHLAARTRALITTVGPYLAYGEPLVAACAEAGTDYVDLTGEPEFVDRMYVAHHTTAERSGARIVHACGFDAVPHDLGAYLTVQQLPDGVPITVRGVVRSRATFSGGTFHSAMTQRSRTRQLKQASAARRK